MVQRQTVVFAEEKLTLQQRQILLPGQRSQTQLRLQMAMVPLLWILAPKTIKAILLLLCTHQLNHLEGLLNLRILM